MSAIKITVKNKTVWQTRMLLPFIRRIAREEFPGTTPKNTRSRLTIHIVYNRGGKHRNYCSGEAYLYSNWSKVRVPYPHPGKVFPVLDFCHVLGHEFAHNKGIRHKDMGFHYGDSCNRGNYSGTHYDWAKALPVPVVKAAPKRPSKAERRDGELKAAKKRCLSWQRKLKLATSYLKKWQRKVKDLERSIQKDAVSQGTKALIGDSSPNTSSASQASDKAACNPVLGEG